MRSETKYIPLSELKVGMEIQGYKKGNTTSFCTQDVVAIKNNTVSLSWGTTLENASDYMFSIELTDEELREKYKDAIQELKEVLNHDLGQVDGYHEMWNAWLCADNLAEMASSLKEYKLRVIGYATLTTPSIGFKVVKWLIGEETLVKWLEKVKNKDKILLTFMFLFPFFPDDVLCFVAGLSSMSLPYFILTIIVCRFLSVFLSAYSLNGNIIPYTTWWGILLWAIIIALVIFITFNLYKNGDKITNYFNKRRKKFENNSSR
mgnify:CR=1 FL=1